MNDQLNTSLEDDENVVAIYSYEKHQSLFKNKKVKLKTLAKAFIDDLNLGLGIINSASEYKLFTPEEIEFIKSRRELLQDWQARLMSDSEHYASEPFVMSDVSKTIAPKLNRYFWQKKVNKLLDKEAHWKSLDDKNSFYANLHQQWNNVSKVATWNHEQLVYIAHDVLPLVQQMVALSLKELKKKHRKVPKELRKPYTQYLTQLQSQLAELNQQIASAMFLRLRIFAKEGRVTTLVNYFKNYTDRQNKKNNDLPSALEEAINEEEPFTEKQFQQFHDYIENHGAAELKKALHRLPWFKDQQLVSVQVKTKKQGRQLVPEALRVYIPKKPGWPQWLFTGKVFRFNFFRNKLFFLSTMSRQIGRDTVAFDKMQTIESFNRAYYLLKNKEQQLAIELNNLEYPTQTYKRFYHGKTKRFLKAWQDKASDLYNDTLSDKLQLAEILCGQVNEALLGIGARAFPWDKSELLTRLIKELKASLAMDDDALAELKARFDYIESQATQAMSAHRAIAVLGKMQQLKVVSQSDIDYFHHYVEALIMDKKHPESLEAFKRLCQPILSRTTTKMAGWLKQVRDRHDVAFDSHLDHQVFKTNIAFVKTHGCDIDIERINKALMKYFLYFLNAVLQNQFNEAHIDIVEDFFIAVGDTATFYGKSIKGYVEELKAARERAGFKHTYPLLGHSIAQQLSEYYFNHRRDKDFARFEHQMGALLANSQHEGQQKALLGIRDKMIDKNQTAEKIYPTLQPFERALIGHPNEGRSIIRDTLNMSAYGEQVKSQLQSDEVTLVKKMQLSRQLGESLRAVFCQRKENQAHAQAVFTKSGRRTLFTKTYIDEGSLTHVPRPGIR